MIDEQLKKLADYYGLSLEEYKKLIKLCSVKNDISISNMDIDKEFIKSNSKLRLMTGIPQIDNLTKGLSIGVNVIAGFMKCCKSTLALNLIYRALNDGLNICLLSIEMPKIEVLNLLISLHSYELDSKTAVSRNELELLYELDRNKYDEYLYSFLSLPGELIIYSENDLSYGKNVKDYGVFSKENLDDMFDKANKNCYKNTGREVDMLVVDNINCIRHWNKKIIGEMAYTLASNYFRQTALNFGNSLELNNDITIGGKGVILLLITQINRTGGKEATRSGFYPPSCIAETVNIERDATTVILIYTDQTLIEGNAAYIKLEDSRYTRGMIDHIEIPIDIAYGKIGYPIGNPNVSVEKQKEIKNRKEYKMITVQDNTGKHLKIVIPKLGKIPIDYVDDIDDEYINIDEEEDEDYE